MIPLIHLYTNCNICYVICISYDYFLLIVFLFIIICQADAIQSKQWHKSFIYIYFNHLSIHYIIFP
jgi:hypothetical protein